MRLPSVNFEKLPLRTPAAPEASPRPVLPPLPQRVPAPVRHELPADLDQRVRLVGEW